jgi:hypothetical protein
MDTSRIKIHHRKGEVAPNTFGDMEWVRTHRSQLREVYGGYMETLQDAREDAEQNLPPEVSQITPVMYFVDTPYGWLQRVFMKEAMRQRNRHNTKP